jgi:hypothetical protein
MAKSSVRLSIKEYDKVIGKFADLLIQIHEQLHHVHDHYEFVLRGDDDGPYWNGKLAKKFFHESTTNIKNNCAAYEALYKVYKALVDKRDKLVRLGYAVRN